MSASVRTDVGCVRESNQDAAQFVRPKLPDLVSRRGALAIVADGMGGHAGGQRASRIAVDTVVGRYYDDDERPPAVALERAVLLANRAIHEEAQAEADLQGMGTTITALAIIGGKGYVAHVGDSRLYRLRNERIEQITVDHTLVQELVEQGTITAAEAATHDDRNVLSRALGTQPKVEVTMSEIDVRAGDRFMICSDGLYDLVPKIEIGQVLALPALPLVADALVALARMRGGHDNITVAALQAQEFVNTDRPTRGV